MTEMNRELTNNAKAWYQLAKDSRLSENQIKGLAFLFSFINSHEKKALDWMTNQADYSVEDRTMLSDRYEMDKTSILGSLMLLNEFSYKVGHELKADRINSNSEIPYVIFISKDGEHLPAIDKDNYTSSLSSVHNLYSVLLEKVGLLIQANSFIESCELGMLYSSNFYASDPSGYEYFFNKFYGFSPPIFKALWNVDFMTTHSKAGTNVDIQYLPFQVALYYLLDGKGDLLGEYVWNLASVLFYKNQKLLYPEKQWLNVPDFLRESVLAIEFQYEDFLKWKDSDYLQKLLKVIDDKYIFNPDDNPEQDASLTFFEQCLFDDYKYTLNEIGMNDSTALQQKACIFLVIALIKTKSLLMFKSSSTPLH